MSNRVVQAEESADRISLYPERTAVCSNAGVFKEPSFNERAGNGGQGAMARSLSMVLPRDEHGSCAHCKKRWGTTCISENVRVRRISGSDMKRVI